MSKKNKQLVAQLRAGTGKKAAASIRKAGMIPVEVYGGTANRSLQVKAVEWNALVREDHDINMIDLKIDNAKITVLVKDIQYSVIKREPMHIDFQEVQKDHELTTSVAIHALLGDPVGLSKGGVLDQVMHEIEISCLPKDMPEAIMVDVSKLDIEQSLHVKELPVLPGVKYNHDENGVVFVVVIQAAAESTASATTEATATAAATV